jgi:hypothetical protein
MWVIVCSAKRQLFSFGYGSWVKSAGQCFVIGRVRPNPWCGRSLVATIQDTPRASWLLCVPAEQKQIASVLLVDAQSNGGALACFVCMYVRQQERARLLSIHAMDAQARWSLACVKVLTVCVRQLRAASSASSGASAATAGGGAGGARVRCLILKHGARFNNAKKRGDWWHG